MFRVAVPATGSNRILFLALGLSDFFKRNDDRLGLNVVVGCAIGLDNSITAAISVVLS